MKPKPWWLACLLLLGCGGGLTLTPIRATSNKPSNVAVYFKVRDQRRRPRRRPHGRQLPHLRGRPARLAVREQADHPEPRGRRRALHAAARRHERQRQRERARSTRSSQAVGHLHRARRRSSRRSPSTPSTASPDLHPIVPFTDQPGSAKAGVAAAGDASSRRTRARTSTAPSSKALDELDNGARQGHAAAQVRHARRLHRRHRSRQPRARERRCRQHIREKPFDVFAIGLGAEIQDAAARRTSARAARRWPPTRPPS